MARVRKAQRAILETRESVAPSESKARLGQREIKAIPVSRAFKAYRVQTAPMESGERRVTLDYRANRGRQAQPGRMEPLEKPEQRGQLGHRARQARKVRKALRVLKEMLALKVKPGRKEHKEYRVFKVKQDQPEVLTRGSQART
jgi:pentatricopeptide repeat protein